MSTPDVNPTPSVYEFTATQDWTSPHEPVWRNLFPRVHSKAPRVLEIGSWEGRSAVFLLSTLCATDGEIVCIDHFDLMGTPWGRERYRRTAHNLALTGRPARILPQFSFPALSTLLREEMNKEHDAGFDWIYIDGSHRSDDTLLDAELAWRLARPGCIIIFDDYAWPTQPFDCQYHPRRGIDAFLAVHHGEYELVTAQYQMVIQKKIQLRGGFLFELPKDGQLSAVFESDLYVALTVDSASAMAATVTLRSVVERDQGRTTLYIVDCGLRDEDKIKIRASLPTRLNLTLVFVALPHSSLKSDMGPVWAKVDMMECLPAERALYLDAGILVRRDLRELWDTDLGGRPLAAAPDIGYPMGHSGVPRGEYFNAGVLLLDLTRIRLRLPELKVRSREMAHSTFHEQDALNVHFSGDWVPLSLGWNAQGLGTYAERTSAEREGLVMTPMEDPAIVHFTGPVHPTMEAVLDPHVQPCTSKPWGYAGAPGHPYERAWWDELEKTAWRGWRETAEHKKTCEKARTEALRNAREEFERQLAVPADAPQASV